MADVQIVTPEEERGLRRITLLDYGLHIASPIVSMMLLSVVALIINYVKREDARGSIWHSHMNWMIRTCWWALFWIVLTGIVALITFGFLSFLVVIPVLWYLYRMIRGLLAALDGRAMPAPQ